jgi:protein O-mannosyl-transferase
MDLSMVDCCPVATDAERERPRPAIWLGLLLVTIIWVYLPSLDGAFVWDDCLLIERSHFVTSLRPLWEYFTVPFWGTDELDIATKVFYRPLVTLSYAFDYALHGQNPTGFHLTNLLLHLVTTSLLFALLRRRGHRGLWSAVLAGLWGLLPRLAECVAWISGRTDLLAGCLTLAALLVWKPTLTRRIVASLLIVAGLFAKEVALAGFFALLAMEWATPEKPWLYRLRHMVLPTAGLLGYFVLRHITMSSAAPTVTVNVEGSRRITLILEAVGSYVRMIALPLWPETQIGNAFIPNQLRILLGASTLILLTLVLILMWRKPSFRTYLSHAAPWLVLTAVALGLVLRLIPLPARVVAADRFLYLPIAGGLLSLEPLWLQSRRLLVAAALILIPLGWATTARAQLWADPIELWSEACRSAPPNEPIPCTELAIEESKAGNYERALGLHLKAIRNDGPRFRTVQNLGILQARLGNYEEAYQATAQAIELRPDIPKGYYDHATMAIRRYRFDEAEALLRRALELLPSYAEPRSVLDQMPTIRQAALELAKPTVDPWIEAGYYQLLGKTKEAEADWLRVIERPKDAEQLRIVVALLVRDGSTAALSQAADALKCGTEATRIEAALCDAILERLQRSKKLKALNP